MTRRQLSVVAACTIAALVLIALLMPSPGLTQDAAFQDTITVTAGGKVTGRPDLAAVSFGIRSNAATAEEAMNELARRQNAVIDALRGIGLAKDQVTTGNIALGRNCRYDRNLDRTVCEGFVGRTSVRAETKDLDQVGKIIDTGVSAGASSVNDVSFERTNENDAIKEALAQAMDLAKAKAEVLATRAGRELGRAIVIEEGGSQRPIFDTASGGGLAASAGVAADVSFRINPADEITKVRIVVTFALT